MGEVPLYLCPGKRGVVLLAEMHISPDKTTMQKQTGFKLHRKIRVDTGYEEKRV